MSKPVYISARAGQHDNRKAHKAGFMLSLAVIIVFAFAAFSHETVFAGVKAQLSDICVKCHPNLKDEMAQKDVHFPFKQGKCGACHDMHVSNYKGLVRDAIIPLCLSCHEDIKTAMKKSYVHGALKKGVCTDCHYAHSSPNRRLLVKPEKDLCWTCHENMKEQLKQNHVHQPFKGGECSSCHNPHGSSERGHLAAAPVKVCKSCHGARCNVNGVSISSFTKDMDCTTCHAGHSSGAKGLLGPNGHSAFLSKNCDQCHNPITSGKAITTKLSGEKLCFSCHKYDPSKYRDNDVHRSKEKNACTMCHSYHASKTNKMTVNETKLCITCHESTEKKMVSMEKTLKNIKCVPIRDRKCFECHMPMHSSRPLYLRADMIQTCARCHETQHKITHPLGAGTVDPRNGKPITCLSCHSMHDAPAEFMLTFDRKRQLCIQCHNK